MIITTHTTIKHTFSLFYHYKFQINYKIFKYFFVNFILNPIKTSSEIKMKKKSFKIKNLIIVGLILALTFININILNDLNDSSDKKYQFLYKNLELANYSSFIEEEGEEINITLHQSLLNTSVICVSNISDPTKNKFFETCPKVENFNSSFVNISIEEIYAPNKTLIIEDDLTFKVLEPVSDHYVSIMPKGCGYIENLSFYVKRTSSNPTTLNVYLFNAVNISGQPRPDSLVYLTPIATSNIIGNTSYWLNLTGIHSSYNCSETFENTFFLALEKQGASTEIEMFGYYDILDGDDEIVLNSAKNLHQVAGESVDIGLKITYAPYIYPSSKTLIIEDDTINEWLPADQIYGSFEVQGVGYLENLSVFMMHTEPGSDKLIDFYICPSENDSGKIRPKETDLTLIASGLNVSSVNWYNITNIHHKFNSSETYNNTFFLYSSLGNGLGGISWGINYDIDGDGVNESIVLDSSENLITRLLLANNTVDLSLKIGVTPFENIPRPENVGIKINNTAVLGFSNIYGSGYWTSTEVYSNFSGQLEFELSTDWWDVSCKITKVQINYTKNDLKANSLFKVVGSEQNVIWNVSRNGGLNFYDSRLSDYRINFTIPSNWNNINVFNGFTNKTGDSSISSSKNGYNDVTVSNAGNGTYWHLTATSENLLEAIHTYIDTNLVNVVNYTNVVKFNATFKEKLAQNNGVINLYIYNPTTINENLIFTSSNSTFASSSKIYLGKWDLSETVTDYGKFRVQVFWSNDTAVGFIEKILTVIAQTKLTVIMPYQEATFHSYEIFNITLYYEDLNLNTPIDGAIIDYNIDGQGWQSINLNNGTIGYYIITIDCGNISSDGLKTVEIQANKDFHESQFLSYNFHIIKGPSPLNPIWIIVGTLSTIGASVLIIFSYITIKKYQFRRIERTKKLYTQIMAQLEEERSQAAVEGEEEIKRKRKEFDNDEGGGFFPYPYIFIPPTPPGDAELIPKPQEKRPTSKEETNGELICKYCGAILSEGESICHVCKNKIN